MSSTLHTATLLVDDPTAYGRAQAYEWIVSRLDRPLRTSDLEDTRHRLLEHSVVIANCPPSPGPSADAPIDKATFHVDPRCTRVAVLSQACRAVFLLDLTASAFRMGGKSFAVVAKDLAESLRHCLVGMLQPLKGNSMTELKPNTTVSVVALHDRRDNDSSFTVLIHDQTLNDAQLVDTVIMPRISEAVSRISSSLTAPRKSPREHNESPQSLFEEVQRNAVNLYSVLDIGTFILEQQCGSSAFATICLLTDGISCTAEAFHRPTRAIQRFLAMNGLLSIVMHRPLAHGPADEGFGIVPAEEHIKFVVSALGGNLSDTRDVGRHARVTRNPDPVSTAALNEATVNFFHNLLLLRFIPLVVDARPRRMLDPGSTLDVYVNMLSPLSSCWNHKGQLSVQIRDQRLNDVDLWTVLKTRLRQGFVLRSLQPRGNGGSIGSGRAASMRSQAKLVYHWHPSILIEYKIRSTAPIMWSFSATALTPMTDGATTTNSSSDIVADSGCRVEVSVRCSHEFANYLIVLMKYANVSSQTTPALTWLYEAKGRALMAFLAELNASDEALSALNSALTSADAVFHVPSALVLTPEGQALCFSDADLDTTSAMDGVFRHYWATLSEAMRKQHAAELAAIDSWSTEILLVHEDVDTAFDDLAHYFHLHWSTFALNRFECVRLNPNGPGYVVAALRRLTPHLVEIRASAVHLGVSQRQEEWVRFSYMLQNAAQRADVAYRPLAKSLSPLLPDEILSGERGIVEVPSRSRNLDYMRTISRSWKIHDRALARDIYRAFVKRHQHQGFLPIFQIKDMASHSVQLLDNGRRYTLSQVEINDDCIITVTFSVEADWSMYSVFDMLHEDEIYVCAQVTFQRLLGLMEETGTEDTASLHAIEQDLVDVSALLPFSRVDTNMYELPSVSHMDYPRSTPAFQPPPNAKLHTLSTGDLLQDSNFTSSHPQLTEDLLAWYFMENELSYYAAVEFDLSSARTCAAFFRQFDKANAMSLDVAEYRCFVVSASAHKLTLVFVPSLVKELARVDFQQECVSVRNIPIYTAHCDVVGMRKRFMQNDKNAMSVLHSEAVDQAIRLLIARAHAQNHYGRLLRGHAVGELALDKDCFRDESIEIDLTPFLNTLVNVTLSDMDDGIIQQRFASIVHQYFNECGNQSMFFRLQRASSSDVATIARTAIHPLFLRLECVLRQPDDIGDVPSSNAIAMNEKILVFPVERLHLPTSYALDGVKDFRPSAFGTIESPVASADGQTVYLRLVYSVLESACVNATTGSTVSATDEGIPLRVPRTMFQLPEDIREALVRFEIDTKLLLKEETLHYLFYWRPMRLPTIELAESLLRAIDMRASARGEISNILRVPLMFVRPKKGMELVQEAMTKLDLSPFMVKPVGCYLLATLTDSAPQPNSALTIVEPFWFFFTLDRNNVVVHFFSRNASVDDATMIMNRARIAVMSACRRVNQLTLLQELNESRYCSKYLLPPDSASDLEDEDEADDGSTSYDPAAPPRPRFAIGEFECNLLGRWLFPLHWRLKPAQTVATLSANVLHPLSVTNRKNVFVYASGSDVFYMRLFDSEEDGTVHLSPAMSIDNVTAVTATGQSTPTEERTTPLDSPSAVPLSASSQRRPTNCLRLEVYGASPLPKSVTDEFVSMIDSKVASLTLATISTLLARNITLKLSQSDADFVLPPTKQPHARMVFAVPHNVTEVHLLLSLLKHNLQSFLVTCNSAELISNLNQYFIAERQDEATTSDRAERIHKLALGDLLFLYNSAVVRPPTVSNEFHAGQGIVAVSAMLLDKNGRVVTMLPESAEMTVPLTVDESGTEPPPFSTPYTIVIHYWAQGEQLNHDAFSQQLQYSVRHAFEDYRLEIAAAAACKAQVGLGDTGKLQADAISAVGRIIAVAASSISFSVRRSVNTLHRFPNEDMETIIAELVHLLAGLGNKCQPRVLRRDKADAQLHPHSVCSTTDVPLTSTPGIDSGDRSFYIYVDFTSTSSDEAADASIQNRPRSKTGADDASLATMRRGSFQLPTPIGGVSGNGDEIMQHAQHTFNVLSTAGFSKETRQRCCFLLLRLCAGKLELVSYNWNATAFASVSSVLHDFAETWNLRHDLLASAAEQKMGLGFGAASLRVAQRGSKDVMPDVYHDVGLSTAIRKRSSSSSHIAYGSSLSACDFAHMPDDCFFEYSPIEMGAVKYQDSVLRHSIPLIHIHRKRSMEQRELQAIRSVHGSWGDRLTAPALSYHDLKRFLRTVRLFHWCRTPLLFSPLRDSLFLLSGSSYICTYTDLDNQFADPRDYHSFPDEPAALAWFRTLARTFTEEYVAYLKSLGMQVVARITDDATFVMSRDLSAKTDAVYLQKSFEGGVLLVEVRLQEMFASVNLYTGKQQMATQADESGLLEVNRQLFRVFIEECAKFKNLIHVNSFVYDFHLRYLSRVFLDQHRVRWLDFLDIVKAFHRYNVTTANFARNRIHRGVFKTPCLVGSEEMVKYISRNASSLHFSNIELKGRITACHFTTGIPDFAPAAPQPANGVAYTLLLYPHDSTEDGPPETGELRLNYFIIIAQLDQRFPKRNTQDLGRDFENQIQALIPNAENRIMRAVEQALRFYGRDSLWRRLIAPLNAPDQLTALTAEDFVVLSTRYNTMPLATFDPDLDTIWQLTTVWSRLLDFMARSYGSLAREFREHSGTGVFRHLIILNPQNSDLIIHFTVDLARNTIRADAVSREKDATGTVSAESTIELEFISDVVRAICRFLWSCAVY